MVALKVVCWAYLIFIVLGRVVNYDKLDKGSNFAKFTDNIMFVALVILIYFLR